MSRTIAFAALAFVATGARAQTSDAPVIPQVHQKMERFVADRQIAGAVTLVAEAGKIVHLDAVGKSDIALDKPMRVDAIAWIASMTKPVTGTAVMMMREEGKLAIDDLVSKHLPEFSALKTKDGKPANLTIRHLLTHTSGLGEMSGPQAGNVKTLAEAIPLFLEQPVAFEPGSQWRYCQSGINTAARIVEVVSGQSFPDFLQTRLFGPLEMKDTTFYLNDEQASRLATSYQRTDKGELKVAPLFILHGKPPTSRDRIPLANGGLFSTARDYAKFCQMILDGGEANGKRFLKPESVQQMTTVQSGDVKTGFTPGNGWGLGWCVVRAPQGVTEMLSPGTFGHGGAFGTQGWIDPKTKRVYVLIVQRSNFPNSDDSPVRRGFQEAAAAALESR